MYEVKRIFSDGDLDGFVATALLVERFRGVEIKFPSPRELNGLVIEDAVSVELSPSKGVKLKNSFLVDHHEYKGVYIFDEEGKPERIMDVDGKSVAEVVMYWIGIGLPDDILDFVNKVDSSPEEVMNDLRYRGYRALIGVQDWRMKAVEGIKGVQEVLKMFEDVGRQLEKVKKKDVIGYYDWKGAIVIYPKTNEVKEEVEINGEKITVDLLSSIMREEMIRLEKDFDIVMMVMPEEENVIGVSLWIDPGVGVDAGRVASMVAERFEGRGGGRRVIAGMQIPGKLSVYMIEELIMETRRVVDELYGR